MLALFTLSRERSLEGFSSPVASPTNRPRTLLLNALNSGSSLLFNIPTFKPSNLQTTNLDAASSITPLFATLTKNTRGGGYPLPVKIFSPSFRPTLANLFRIRTYEKRARNPFRIRTSKTRHLKPFRIRTYEKTPGEGVVMVNQKSDEGFLSRATIGRGTSLDARRRIRQSRLGEETMV
jgi:hypothetical protein